MGEKAEPTPGPWAVHPVFKSHVVPSNETDKRIGGASDPDKDRKAFAKVVHHARGNPRRFSASELAANAQLIAAAPELLAALEATTRELIGERDCLYESVSLPDGSIPDGEDQAGIAEMDRVIDQARAAIKKARGEINE